MIKPKKILLIADYFTQMDISLRLFILLLV